MKSIAILAGITFLAGALYAQIPQKGLYWPSKYLGDIPECKIDYEASSEKVSKLWIVHADHSNVSTTRNPGGGGKVGTLKFMQSYYVVEEQGAYIHIVEDPDIAYVGDLSPKAKDMGWMHKKDILVWEHCLVTCGEGMLDKKAMILNTVASIKSVDKEKKYNELRSQAVKFYKDPGLSQPSGRKAGLFQIYFIYKEVGNSVLLGKNARIVDHRHADNNILGWVPSNRLVRWDQRVALEPNTHVDAWQERMVKGKTMIFSDAASARAFRDNGGKPADRKKVMWDDDPKNKRPVGQWRRFPITGEKIENGVAKIGLMGDIATEYGGIVGSYQAASTERKEEVQRREARNIDIMFVVDATTSMGPYFEPISNAIVKSMRTISIRQDGNSYRFGAVCYRDNAEKDRCVELIRLTSNGGSVSQFLKNIDAKDYFDKDKPEAVNYGIKKALLETGMNKEHTNLVIVVGDAGNHTRNDNTYVGSEEVSKDLAAFNANVLVFQARHSSQHPTYNDFVSESQQIIRSVAFSSYEKVKTMDKKMARPPIPEEVNGVWRMKGPMAGTVRACAQDSKLLPEILENDIQEIIQGVGENLNQVLSAADQMVSDGASFESVLENYSKNQSAATKSPFVSSFAPSILWYLLQSGITREELKTVTGQSYQLFMEAYAPVDIKGQKNAHFTPVLFLSRLELTSLIQEVEKVLDAATNEKRREAIVSTWYELLRSHIGSLDRNVFDEMSMEQVTQKLYGIPSKSSLLTGTQISDMMDRSKVPDDELNKYETHLRDKLQDLKIIFNKRDYKYSFESNNISYYWIDQDLLP